MSRMKPVNSRRPSCTIGTAISSTTRAVPSRRTAGSSSRWLSTGPSPVVTYLRMPSRCASRVRGRDEQLAQLAADGLLAGPAEQHLGRRVELHDAAPLVDGDDGVQGGPDDGSATVGGRVLPRGRVGHGHARSAACRRTRRRSCPHGRHCVLGRACRSAKGRPNGSVRRPTYPRAHVSARLRPRCPLHGHRCRRVDRPARGRSPRAGQAVRRAGDPVHGRLRAHDVVPPPRRDRVRRQGDPARRLHPDDRHVPPAPR